MQVAAWSETAPGEPSRLERLFVEHHGRVFRAAYRVTGNVQDAEDILQTVFLRLAQQAAGTPAPTNVESYLYRAAVNASIDLLRTRRDRTMVGLEDAEGSLPSSETPETSLATGEMRAWLRRSLAKLTPREGEVFALRYLEGRANKDIASLLGVSRLSVAVALHRARRRLHQELRRTNTEGGRR